MAGHRKHKRATRSSKKKSWTIPASPTSNRIEGEPGAEESSCAGSAITKDADTHATATQLAVNPHDEDLDSAKHDDYAEESPQHHGNQPQTISSTEQPTEPDQVNSHINMTQHTSAPSENNSGQVDRIEDYEEWTEELTLAYPEDDEQYASPSGSIGGAQQLQAWVYETSNTKLTQSEIFQKACWGQDAGRAK